MFKNLQPKLSKSIFFHLPKQCPGRIQIRTGSVNSWPPGSGFVIQDGSKTLMFSSSTDARLPMFIFELYRTGTKCTIFSTGNKILYE